jgi:hypothetical protein
MSAPRRIGIFLLVAGLLVLAGSGVIWRKHTSEMVKLHADHATLEDSLKALRKKRIRLSLMARGVNESPVPDSVRAYGAGKMMDITTGYNKAVRTLHFKERDIKLEIASVERDTERALGKARTQTLPVAGAGAALLVTGIVLTVSARRREGA